MKEVKTIKILVNKEGYDLISELEKRSLHTELDVERNDKAFERVSENIGGVKYYPYIEGISYFDVADIQKELNEAGIPYFITDAKYLTWSD